MVRGPLKFVQGVRHLQLHLKGIGEGEPAQPGTGGRRLAVAVGMGVKPGSGPKNTVTKRHSPENVKAARSSSADCRRYRLPSRAS